MKNLLLLAVTTLLVACAADPPATPEPMPLASPTLHPLFQERASATQAAPAPTRVASATLASEPTPLVDRPRCDYIGELAAIRPPGQIRAGPWPRPAPAPGLLHRVATNQRYVNLSFNIDYPYAELESVLEVLAAHAIFANVFLSGSVAEAKPELLQAITAGGHEIGTLGYELGSVAALPAAELLAQLERAETALQVAGELSGRPWFRPPTGFSPESNLQAAFGAGWTTVGWSGATMGRGAGSLEEIEDAICSELLAAARPGAILAVRAIGGQTAAAIDRFIREMHAAGYLFMPLSVLTAPDPAAFLER